MKILCGDDEIKNPENSKERTDEVEGEREVEGKKCFIVSSSSSSYTAGSCLGAHQNSEDIRQSLTERELCSTVRNWRKALHKW